MESKEKIDGMLGKIGEIREFLKIRDEIIPFLSELFTFIKDVMPIMSDADASLHESASKIPDAADRISDVSQTTEMATNEILDKLDSLTEKLTTISQTIQEDQKKLVDEMQDEVMDIIYALQFQDITSQKLDHANRILEVIFKKFTVLLESIEHIKVNTNVGSRVLQAIKGEIDSEKGEKRRKEFEKKIVDTVRESGISQDDIDKLFS